MTWLSTLPGLLLILGSPAQTPDGGETCPSIAMAGYWLGLPVAKAESARFQPGDTARNVLVRDRARLQPLKHCPSVQYAILRARELLGCDPGRTLQMAEEARRLLPESAPIAAIWARFVGTEAAARSAVAVDPAYVPSQLVVVSALLDAEQWNRASALLAKTSAFVAKNSGPRADVRSARARLRLARHDHRGAIADIRFSTSVGDGEPDSCLEWPWNDSQVAALAHAEIGNATEGARWLVNAHVGTLPELRSAAVRRTKAAMSLITAMERVLEKVKSEGTRTDLTVALARLLFLAGDVDKALALVASAPDTQARFCITLPELAWVLSGGGVRPVPQMERLQSACSTGSTKLPSEPPECLSSGLP